jgi:hypothetical protein
MRYEPVWALRVGAVIMAIQLLYVLLYVGFSDWRVLGR